MVFSVNAPIFSRTSSEEMYRKLNAEYDADSNPFAGLGLSSPSFTYSNIDNGAGWFCAYSKSISDWMIE